MGTAHEQVGGKKESCHGLVQLLQVCRSGKCRNWSIRYLNETWNSAFVHGRIFGKFFCVGKLVNFYSSVSQSIAQTLTQSLFVCLVSQIKITSRKSDLP